MFKESITPQEIEKLEYASFPGKIYVIDSVGAEFNRAIAYLRSQKVIGFDTETRPSFRAGVSYKVALLQLSTEEVCYLFRLSQIRLSNTILKILGSKQIVKVGADVTGDIRALHALRHFHADGFVDLQVEASRWGIEEKSLRKLSAIVLGQRVSKAQRLSNWEATILTDQQQEYAATDAWVCTRILNVLENSESVAGERTIISVAPPREVTQTGEAKDEGKRHRKHRKRRNKENKQTNI